MLTEPSAITAREATLEAYLALPETVQIVEFIDGVLETIPTPSDLHQASSWQLTLLLSDVIARIPGAVLRYAPLTVILDDKNAPEPDIFVVLPGGLCQRDVHGYWRGAPDLIVEILSPTSVRRDKIQKFELYERAGVREYWIVDPEPRSIEVWALRDGIYERLGIHQSGAVFLSPALGGVEIAVDIVFKN